jgi:hypothetical protein
MGGSMQLRVGMRLASTSGPGEVVVVRAPQAPGELSCAGQPMREPTTQGEMPATSAPEAPSEPTAQILLGKRYTSEDGSLEVLCTKPGPGPLAWNGIVLSVKAPKPLPSSD